MPKPPSPITEAFNPLSREGAADVVEKLRLLRDRSRMLRADIRRAAEEEEIRRERIHSEPNGSNWDDERIAQITEVMGRAQDHMNEAVRLQAGGTPKPDVRRKP